MLVCVMPSRQTGNTSLLLPGSLVALPSITKCPRPFPRLTGTNKNWAGVNNIEKTQLLLR